MSSSVTDDSPYFLSTLPAGPRDWRLAGTVIALSLLVFAALAPFAKTQLAAVGAFIPGYQSSLVVIDSITVALLFGQFLYFNSWALFVLACGYLFTALITMAHTFSFPGLFAPTGLFGAGSQSTAWLYMFWHGGFPLFVLGYSMLKGRDPEALQAPARHSLTYVATAFLTVLAIVAGFTALATQGAALLPPIMDGNRYTPSMIVVVSSVWGLSLLALAVLALRRPHSVLDLWLMVVMCAWLIDIALAAVLNQGRFDLGFYAGRIYGLLAASFVLLVLLAESGLLYRKLVQLTAALRKLTTQDALTGIANRRAFDGALDVEWRRATRSGQPLSLMMIDVDHFKLYNDGYGHVEGDECLRAVAAALQGAVTRATDLVARYGGEEFAVLLPQTDAEAAGQLGERLRAAVANIGMPHKGAASGQVSISVGVASVRPAWSGTGTDGSHSTSGALIEAADKALYEAKSGGRNRVVVNKTA